MLTLIILGAILLIVGIGLQRYGIEPWGWICAAIGALLLIIGLVLLLLEVADEAGDGRDGLALVGLGMAYGGHLSKIVSGQRRKTMSRPKPPEKSVVLGEIRRVDDRKRTVEKLASRVRRPRARKGSGTYSI